MIFSKNDKIKSLERENKNLRLDKEEMHSTIRQLEFEKDRDKWLTGDLDLWKKLIETGVTSFRRGELEIKK